MPETILLRDDSGSYDRLSYTAEQLANYRVTIFAAEPPTLACAQCHTTWNADAPRKDARRRRLAFWRCPNNCNRPA